MKERLQQLRAEYDEGCRQMALLDRRRQELRDTMLRIRGAIQVLEELLTRRPGDPRPEEAEPFGNVQ
jgi:hypothetical protein